MKKAYARSLSAGLLAILGMIPAAAQAADYEVHNVAEQISGKWASAYSDLVIGPNAVITVDGDWYVTAGNIYIHPSARILGAGTLHLMSPSAYGSRAAAATRLDGGGTTIGCRLSIENGSTVVLAAIDPAASYPAAGITDPGGAGSNDLRMANNLNFNNAGAHIVLGDYNISFTADAGATVTRNDLNSAGFTPDPAPAGAAEAYLVTSGSGVVRKEGLANAASFSYPVGQSAPGDYTPATVTNTAAARDISVQVKTYGASGAAMANTGKGMDRTWQIYGNAAGAATVSLQHNAGSEGAAFDHNAAFVTQQTAAGNWSSGTPALPGTPNYTHTGSFDIPVFGASSYFSKSSDVQSSISRRALITPVALLQGAMNGAAMTTTLNTLNLIPLAQPYHIAPFSYAGTEKVASIPAGVTDWVLVELRSAAAPATILGRRAAFIKKEGAIVDIDGTSPVAFRGIDPGNYYISVRHRNHLGVITAAAQPLNPETPATYDFTTAAAQAAGANAMVSVDGRYALWGGNTDYGTYGGHQLVSYSAACPSDVDAVRLAVTNAPGNMFRMVNFNGASVSNLYSVYDVNLDGNIRYSAPADQSDVDFIRLNVTNFPTNMFRATNITSVQEQLP